MSLSYRGRSAGVVGWAWGVLMGALLAVATMGASPSAHAQVVGPLYEVNIYGVPLTCRSYAGEPVATYFNYQLDNVGVATRAVNGVPVIVVNPNVLNQFSSLVAQWWFAHECAHHALPPHLNNEVNADCFGVRELRRLGLLHNQAQLQAFSVELLNLPGSPMGHLPGPARARHIVNCALY